MKRTIICISLLALSLLVAGCAKQSGTAKQPVAPANPSATSTDQETTVPTPHTTMKPVTPEAGSGQPATSTETKQPAADNPAAEKVETPASTNTDKK